MRDGLAERVRRAAEAGLLGPGVRMRVGLCGAWSAGPAGVAALLTEAGVSAVHTGPSGPFEGLDGLCAGTGRWADETALRAEQAGMTVWREPDLWNLLAPAWARRLPGPGGGPPPGRRWGGAGRPPPGLGEVSPSQAMARRALDELRAAEASSHFRAKAMKWEAERRKALASARWRD